MIKTMRSPDAKEIMDEINMDQFIKRCDETECIKKAMFNALNQMHSKPTEYHSHIDVVHEFFTILWQKYDCEDIIKILDTFTMVEPPILDLERASSKAYRDHYVHTFNVFILGLRILSKIILEFGVEASKILKVNDERLHEKIDGFHDYNWKERLFYIWTLISNFHDISVPITRLDSFNKGLNAFFHQFGLVVTGPSLEPNYPSDLGEFCHNLSCIYEGKLNQKDDWLYQRSQENHYISSMLKHEFRKNNHGVLSSYLMYEKMDEIFLEGRNKAESRLDIDKYNIYVDNVLKEDIARAALAISFHDLSIVEKTGYPKCLPIDFSDFPLTYLLIIVDSMQEYLRWEGTSIKGNTKFLSFPQVKITKDEANIKLDFCFIIEKDEVVQNYLLSQAKSLSVRKSLETMPRDYKEASQLLFKEVCQEIKSKVNITNPLLTVVVVDKTSDTEVYSQTLSL
jgi:hypothetical protein